MNKLLLFDVDGTLAESGKKINEQIENLLNLLTFQMPIFTNIIYL